MKKIKKEDKIADIISKYPESLEIFLDYGLHCVGCFLNQFETINEGAKAHGMTDGEIEKMIKEINKSLRKKGQ